MNGLTTKAFAPALIASSTLLSWPSAEHYELARMAEDVDRDLSVVGRRTLRRRLL